MNNNNNNNNNNNSFVSMKEQMVSHYQASQETMMKTKVSDMNVGYGKFSQIVIREGDFLLVNPGMEFENKASTSSYGIVSAIIEFLALGMWECTSEMHVSTNFNPMIENKTAAAAMMKDARWTSYNWFPGNGFRQGGYMPESIYVKWVQKHAAMGDIVAAFEGGFTLKVYLSDKPSGESKNGESAKSRYERNIEDFLGQKAIALYNHLLDNRDNARAMRAGVAAGIRSAEGRETLEPETSVLNAEPSGEIVVCQLRLANGDRVPVSVTLGDEKSAIQVATWKSKGLAVIHGETTF